MEFRPERRIVFDILRRNEALTCCKYTHDREGWQAQPLRLTRDGSALPRLVP
jgi:hypothetical protein